jgi:hypothetical protein
LVRGQAGRQRSSWSPYCLLALSFHRSSRHGSQIVVGSLRRGRPVGPCRYLPQTLTLVQCSAYTYSLCASLHAFSKYPCSRALQQPQAALVSLVYCNGPPPSMPWQPCSSTGAASSSFCLPWPHDHITSLSRSNTQNSEVNLNTFAAASIARDMIYVSRSTLHRAPLYA